MNKTRLESQGEYDYDLANDILFFKVKNREYDRSVEFGNIVIDIDSENHVVGLQIFEASKFLHLSKEALKKIPHWKCDFIIEDGILQINLVFKIMRRNKTIQKNPIIQQETNLPDSKLKCYPA